jgi:glycogen operon protein
MIDHLKRLGVTTIELLPMHALIDDRMLVEKKLVNYWGYNTIGFFAPERAMPRTMRWIPSAPR